MKKLLFSISVILFTKGLIGQSVDLISRLGGAADDQGRCIVADAQGNVYVAGFFVGTDAVTSLTSAGGNDIFIAKFQPSGQLVWAKRAGGTGSDKALGLALSGNDLYISGEFSGTANFNTPSANGTNEITSAGGSDIFFAKYNTDGTFQWAKRAGGSLNDYGWGIVTNGNDVYATGVFSETADFNTPSSAGSNEITSAGITDIFLVKLNSDGDFQWAKRAGGADYDTGVSVALSGNDVYVAGHFQSTSDFNTPSASGSNEVISDGGSDSFLAKYNSNGDIQWVKRLGGTSFDYCRAMAANGTEIYLTGVLANGSINFNTPSSTATNVLNGNYGDFYLAKFDSDGNFGWAKRGGGSAWGLSVNLDDIYISGAFAGSVNFTTPYSYSNPAHLTSAASNQTDGFLVNFDSNGDFQWAKRFGGSSGSDFSLGNFAINNEIYVTGYFYSVADFNTPSSSGSNEITSAGGQDVFYAKFIDHNCSTTLPSVSLSSNELTVDISGADFYTWIDCNNSNSEITGETNQSFTPTISGSYAVIVNVGACEYTSACTEVTISNTSSIIESNATPMSLYPNPTNDIVNFINLVAGTEICISDITGKIVFKTLVNSTTLTISTAEWANGLYLVQTTVDGIKQQNRLIVNK